MLKRIVTGLLDIAYDEQGDADGWPVDWSTAIPSLTISSAACPTCRRSRCPRSRSKGTPMAFRHPGEGRQTHSASPDAIRTASCRTPAIIFRRRHPKRSLTRSSTSTHGPLDALVRKAVDTRVGGLHLVTAFATWPQFEQCIAGSRTCQGKRWNAILSLNQYLTIT